MAVLFQFLCYSNFVCSIFKTNVPCLCYKDLSSYIIHSPCINTWYEKAEFMSVHVHNPHVHTDVSLTWENLSLGIWSQERIKLAFLATETRKRLESLNLARQLVSFYLTSEQQRCWSDWLDAQANLQICCSHMAKQVSSWHGSYDSSSLNSMHVLSCMGA